MTQPGPEARYEVARKGNPIGIHALGEFAGLISSGTLLWTDDCWTEGMEAWCKLSDLKEQIEAGAASAAPAQGAGNGPLYAGVTVATLLVVGVIVFFSGEGEPAAGAAEAPATSAAPARAITAREKAHRLSLSETQQQISELIATSFVRSEDSASGGVSYVHRYYVNIGNRIPLRVHVDSTGRRWLYTYYLGRSWIFHNQLSFEFSGQTAETTALPPHTIARDVGENNLVSESCRFLGEEDAGIVGRLALASATPIKMRMLGRKPLEVPLSSETKVAIKESYALAELLAKRSRLLADWTSSP